MNGLCMNNKRNIFIRVRNKFLKFIKIVSVEYYYVSFIKQSKIQLHTYNDTSATKISMFIINLNDETSINTYCGSIMLELCSDLRMQ